jgi:hypothetical protein
MGAVQPRAKAIHEIAGNLSSCCKAWLAERVDAIDTRMCRDRSCGGHRMHRRGDDDAGSASRAPTMQKSLGTSPFDEERFLGLFDGFLERISD